MTFALSKKQRIAILITAAWLVLTLAGAINAGQSSDEYGDPSSFHFAVFAKQFLIFGLLPPVILWGIAWVKGFNKFTHPINEQIDYTAGEPFGKDVLCPTCGTTMKLRTSKTGPYAGKVFWGCVRYPACITVLPVGADSPQVGA